MSPSSSELSPEDSPVSRWIREYLEDQLSVFVFPSEITARFWLRRAFAYSRRKVLRADRFLDWGDFKKTYLHYEGGGRAINRAERTLFAWRLLEENSRRPFFRELIPPEQAGSPEVFLASIVKALPGLSRLPGLARRWPASGTDKRDDLLRLYRDYRRYLRSSSLYEPSFEIPRLETGRHRVLIFFPEVIEDFQEYAALIAAHAGAATVAVPPLPAAERKTIAVHDNLPDELEHLLGLVEILLDAGTVPEDVVLSVADLANLEPLLARRAELRGIPLAIHRSRSVTSFPASRLFGQIREVVSARFSLEPLKDLLLNRALPWRQPSLAEGLVRLGLDNRLLRSLPAGLGAAGIAGETGATSETSAASDGWEKAFRRTLSLGNPRSQPLEELRRFYRGLRRHLRIIHSAPSFHALKERLTAFARSYLDTTRWRPEELGVFQFALDKLDELQEAAATLAARSAEQTGSAETPAFELWLSYLGDELYLPKRREAGVPVYDYPVAEGIEPPHHFLANASHEGTSHTLKPVAGLNPYEEESLEIRERDLGPEHLRLYLHSGQRVAISYSRRGLSRSHLPPTLFVMHGSVTEAVAADDRPAASPETRERLAWTTGEPFALIELQQQGFRHAAATALAPRGLDATVRPVEDPGLAAALARRLYNHREAPEVGAGENLDRDRHADGSPRAAASVDHTLGDAARRSGANCLRISPTALELFYGCPFAYLLQNALGVRADEYTVTTSDPRELGAIMHRVFERFFRTLAGAGEAGLETSQHSRYRTIMLEAVESACRDWERKNPPPFAPLWLELQDRARELALTFLAVELDQMRGERVADVELRLEVPFDRDPEVLLVGKIDRVSSGDFGTTIVDYKKKKVPSEREIFGPLPTSFQMPFYLHLMQARGRSVERAAYYSIEEGRYRFVLGDRRGAAAPGPVDTLFGTLERLQERVLDMARRIRGGDYTIPAEGAPACRNCDYAELCRRRYLMGSPS